MYEVPLGESDRGVLTSGYVETEGLAEEADEDSTTKRGHKTGNYDVQNNIAGNINWNANLHSLRTVEQSQEVV